MAAVTTCGVCGEYTIAETAEFIVPFGAGHYIIVCPECKKTTPHE